MSSEQADLEAGAQLVRDDIRILSRSFGALTIPPERRARESVRRAVSDMLDGLQPIVDRRLPAQLITGMPEPWQPPNRKGFA